MPKLELRSASFEWHFPDKLWFILKKNDSFLIIPRVISINILKQGLWNALQKFYFDNSRNFETKYSAIQSAKIDSQNLLCLVFFSRDLRLLIYNDLHNKTHL